MSARFPAAVLEALQAGNGAAAEQICRRRLATLPRDQHARALLPLALLHQQRYLEAIPLLERLVREQRDDSSHATNLGLALVSVGRLDAAIETLAQTARRWPREATVRAALGLARLQRGFAAAAMADLEAALAGAPDDTHAGALLARAMIEAGGRQERAGALADALLLARPQDPATLAELALALIGLQRDAEAEQCLSRALAVDPAFAAARIHLASLYERQNRLSLARRTLEATGLPGRSDPLWRLAQARLLRREGRPEEAVVALEALRTESVAGPIGADVCTELGRSLHDLRRYDAAFVALEHANQAMLEIESGAAGGRRGKEDQGPWLLRTYTAVEVAGWSPPVAPAADTPVFVVGFPRSGTTLLENMLDAHPDLQALEEKPAVDAMLTELERRGDLDAGLARFDETMALAVRAAYWRETARHLERRASARLVDRYPLNMARLAIITRAFPGAPIVLLVRHPCDVVLSCFMQNFRIADGTAGFHTLLNGARIYDRLMRKWLEEVAAFAPNLLTLRYEDLVADVQGNLAALVKFLGVTWNDRLLDHASHAMTRGRIHTPSYAQVVQPVYATAVQRWRRYEQHFGAAVEVLAPWVRYWGYDETTA